jgi:hypothetical protein
MYVCRRHERRWDGLTDRHRRHCVGRKQTTVAAMRDSTLRGLVRKVGARLACRLRRERGIPIEERGFPCEDQMPFSRSCM